MNGKALRLEKVSRVFGSVPAVADFSLAIDVHEFVALVGPSGCGKTTLLNMLSGYDRPTSGTVTRSGRTRTIHQQDGLYPWLTVRENIALGLNDVRDADERERQMRDLVSFIRLEGFEKHYPHQLSGGMRQRVEIARALAGHVDILLMDEPFSALDYITRLHMRQELALLLRDRPRTVVFVTHDIEEAAQLADRVIVLTDRPARIRCELRIDLDRPRSLTHPEVVEVIHRTLAEMGLESEAPMERGRAVPALAGRGNG
jgi:ABC-type nitrate/sulfonate/bicarbonate transport system ATPase subunit